jgi:hypothetical protein
MTPCLFGHGIEHRYRSLDGHLYCRQCKRLRRRGELPKRSSPEHRFQNRHGRSWCRQCRRDDDVQRSFRVRRMSPEAVRARADARRARYQRERTEAIRLLGGSCPCGETRTPALQFDHIGDDGAAHRFKLGGCRTHIIAQEILADLNAAKRRYQLLCANCNLIKYAALRGEWVDLVPGGVTSQARSFR